MPELDATESDGRRRRRRAGRARRRDHPGPLRHRARLLVERRTEPSTLPRATVVSTRSMELLRAWGLERGGPRRRRRRRVAGSGSARPWPRRRTGAGDRGRLPHRASRPRSSARPRRRAVPQDWLEAVLRRHLRAARPSGSSPARAGRASTTTRTACAHDCARRTASAAHRRRPATSSPPTAPTAPSAGMLGVACSERGAAPTAACRSCSARRSGPLLGDAPLRPLRRHHPGGAGAVPARPVRRPLGLRPGCRPTTSGSPASTRGRLATRSAVGAGVADLDPRIERIGPFLSPGEIADRFRVGRVVPGRRRRAPGHATRRHRHEHRPAERPRPRLEAGLGAAGLGRARRCSTPTRPSGGVVAEHNVARSTDPDGSRRPVLDELESTSAAASPTPGCPRRPGGSRRSTSSGPGGRCSPDRRPVAGSRLGPGSPAHRRRRSTR